MSIDTKSIRSRLDQPWDVQNEEIAEMCDEIDALRKTNSTILAQDINTRTVLMLAYSLQQILDKCLGEPIAEIAIEARDALLEARSLNQGVLGGIFIPMSETPTKKHINEHAT